MAAKVPESSVRDSPNPESPDNQGNAGRAALWAGDFISHRLITDLITGW